MSFRNVNVQKVSTLSTIKLLISCLVNIKDETGEFLMPLADGRIIDTKGWNDWEWTHGVGLYGLYKFYQITGDAETLKIMLDWFRDRFEIGTTKNVNTMSPLLTAAYLHASSSVDVNYLPHLEAWGDWAMHDMPRTDEDGMQHITYIVDNYQQLWDDTLMMTVLPLAKIGLVLGKPEYVEEAKRQFLLHVKYLQDTQTNLFFHGWTFDGRHHFGRTRWARGNCWITVSIPDFIEMLSLPPEESVCKFLKGVLKGQIDALVDLQDKQTGLWHTILDDPTSYLEASATAGFTYGILKALRTRLIPKEERYVNCAKQAIQGIFDNITVDGELKQVSFGTPVFDDPEDYKKVKLTSMPYGQSLALLALTEHLRTFL
ncbi:glycoside hydrolase family 105 protein [Fistulina hepatica ATCC 64428]|uniref:Glycoside hydrolase family 105 protein n=1 Tax=Fistulina hepatica ATCC 64428 TaxID=1128425 RepID=A0A0D7AAA5_9AGAR|nr:glycoside hydrolase family 105 protein [Fistulina hepatica ATCC 64428]